MVRLQDPFTTNDAGGAMVDHVYINGRFHTSAKAKISIEDRGFLYGDGVFETMRSYKGKVFMLFMHLERLFHSLKVLKFNPGFDQRTVIDALYKTMAKSGLAKKDAYLKVMVTRGKHSGALHFSQDGNCSLVIIVKKLKPYPEEYYTKGTDIISSCIKRQDLGEQVYGHKLMNYFENLYEKDRAYSQGAFEPVFLTRDKLVLEGATTNIFMVKRSAVYTPPLSQNILGGITRKVILQLCRANRIRTLEKKIHYRDLINTHEAFLTNSVAGIIPVKKVDVHEIGSAVPGKITSRLSDLYRLAVEKS
jgi:branched-chain amino acid aminotransferase